MNRVLVAATCAVMFAGLLPAAVFADRVTKFSDHAVEAFCEQPIDGGYASGVLATSTAFGSSANVSVWFDPAVPFEDPAAASGSTDAVSVTEGTDVILSATFQVFDPNGGDLGEATIVATMTRVGDPQSITPPPKSNHHSATEGTFQQLEGSATLTYPGVELTIGCSGDITDISVFEANPDSFVTSSFFTQLGCSWETDGAVAGLFVVQDNVGFFADLYLLTPDVELFTSGFSGSIDAASMSASADLQDAATGDAYTGSASATFTPIGDPVTYVLRSAGQRVKTVEQKLGPDGVLQFSTGNEFAIDADHCFASTGTSHGISTSPSGPKPGAAPVNDTPSGAIALEPGDKLNERNTGAALDAEVPITTCPEGEFDNFGHTLWYTVAGTGGTLTIDTAKSNIDTVLAVYTRDGDTFTEIACIDDVFFDPIGLTFQASITGETELGVTYWVQVGGFRFFDGPAQSGLLHVAVY